MNSEKSEVVWGQDAPRDKYFENGDIQVVSQPLYKAVTPAFFTI